MKKNILFFILGLIVMAGISTVAYSYTAKQVSFTPNDKSWKVSTVDDALNSIKTTMPDLQKVTISSASDIISGKKAYDSNGNLITGTYTDNCVYKNIELTDDCLSNNGCKILDFVPRIFFLIENNQDANGNYWIMYYNANNNGSENWFAIPGSTASRTLSGAIVSLGSQLKFENHKTYFVLNSINDNWSFIACK